MYVLSELFSCLNKALLILHILSYLVFNVIYLVVEIIWTGDVRTFLAAGRHTGSACSTGYVYLCDSGAFWLNVQA